LSEDLKNATLILSAILVMSNRAEALGGAASIEGVASLSALQTSIQKNKHRIEKLIPGVLVTLV
jgi:hypothetical protein